MKNILILGSSGMVGSLVLEQCLLRADVATITIINRQPSMRVHSKLVEIIHTDFLDFEPIRQAFSNQDGCFYCVGVYTGQVPTQMFKTITIDFVKAVALVLKTESPQAVFCFLSGMGADSTEKSRLLFANAKGQAENYLIATCFQRLHIFRPGYIHPVRPRRRINFLYSILQLVYKYVSFIYPNMGLTALELAKAMVTIGFDGNSTVIMENRAIRAIARSN